MFLVLRRGKRVPLICSPGGAAGGGAVGGGAVADGAVSVRKEKSRVGGNVGGNCFER